MVLQAQQSAPSPAQSASLSGTIKSAAPITRISAVDRTWADVLKTSELVPKEEFLYDGTIDAATGLFRIQGLLPGRAYDLIVWTKDAQGREIRWEGASMEYHRPIIPSTPATADDRKAIEALITDPPQFYDKVRPLRIAADHQHAAVLVELIRTRDFHSDAGGEVIYRVELWYFENLFGGWAKDKNTEKVVARVRGKPGALQQNWQFLPQLGGLSTAASATAPASQPALVITFPDAPDLKNGIAGGIK